MKLDDHRRTVQMHLARERTVTQIFNGIPKGTFSRVLELGAGDCYQSQFIKPLSNHLTCTDFDLSHRVVEDADVRYLQCDAEIIAERLAGEKFDMIFSSNMLQHCPDKRAVLRQVETMLAPDGIVVFVLPCVWWKLFKLASFYPVLGIRIASAIWRRLKPKVRTATDKVHELRSTNNPKFPVKHGRLRKLLFPIPVGAYHSNFAELLAFRRSAWLQLFQGSKLEVVGVKRGPFLVGDFTQRINAFFAWLGLSTETVYILKHRGAAPSIQSHFE